MTTLGDGGRDRGRAFGAAAGTSCSSFSGRTSFDFVLEGLIGVGVGVLIGTSSSSSTSASSSSGLS